MKNGTWVYCPSNLFGPAQVVEEGDLITEVRVGATPATSRIVAVRTKDLRAYVPRPGDPIWLPLAGKTWAQCAFVVSHNNEWHVESSLLPHSIGVTPSLLWLKSHNEPVRAMDMLREAMTSEKGDLTPRLRFRQWLAGQAAHSGGYSALLSAPVRPVPHQINAVARVMSDPVRRFLLADEVGLGKTIEAGLIIRQVLLDDPRTSVVVVVPGALKPQWIDELRRKLRLEKELNSAKVVVLTHDEVASIPECGLLVVDEAHRLCEENRPEFLSFALLTASAHHASSLLLLSATPLRGKAETLLRMLHLIDPTTFALEDLEGFRVRLANRASQAQTLNLLKFETHRDIVGDLIAELRPTLPQGHGLDHLIDRLALMDDHQERRIAVEELVTTIRNRFRIGGRIIRTARTSVDPLNFPVPGRRLVELKLDHKEGPLVDAIVEDWLDRVRTTSSEIPQQFGDFLTAALGGMRSLRAFALGRLGELSEGASQVFPAELMWLREILAAPESADDFVELVLKTIRGRFARQLPPEVVAASSPLVAQSVHKDLVGRLGPNLVAGYLAHHGDSERRRVLEALDGPTPPRVVVIDRSAEEGCNLQRARGIVNLDLLWDVNRFEQRLGRLDRYAPGVASPTDVIVPTNTSSQLRTDFIAFLTAVGVFNRSVSTVQRALSGVMERLEASVFQNGLAGLRVDADQIAKELRADLLDVELLEFFESQDVSEEFPEQFIEGLLQMDENWVHGQRALNGMTARDGGYDIRRKPVREDGAAFHYDVTDHTRLVEPWRSRLGASAPKFATVSRPLALENDHYVLLRSGHSFIDQLERSLLHDERGRVEIRRIIDPFATRTEVAFKVELAVFWELETSGLSMQPAVLSGLRRRLETRLPCRFVEVAFDDQGEFFDQVEEWFEGRQNERIGAMKLVELLKYCGDWDQLVKTLGLAIEMKVAQPLEVEIDSATEALKASSRRRLQQLHSSETHARDFEAEAQLVIERSARNKVVRLESVQVLIKSAVELGGAK